MKRLLLFAMIFLYLSCASTYVESIVTSQGTVLEIDGARFEIPENSVTDSVLIRIEKKSIGRRSYEQGFSLDEESFVIKPETLFFEKPILFSLAIKDQNTALGAKIGKGFVPIANSKVESETLRAKIWHGGEYYVISEPEQYGIRDHSKTQEGMLIVSDIYVSDYIRNFKNALKKGGYNLPIWTFIYSNENSIEDNAFFLADELKELHEQYGDFRLDIVSFGVGGLIAHRYVADTTLYQRDISPAIIAIGTPFFGSNFASIDNAKKGKSPFRFFFIDGMGDYSEDLAPQSDFINWIKAHKRLRGGWLKDPKEDKNPASIRGKMLFAGELAEEQSGDGLVSLSSTMLTAIEPEPFILAHFDLFEDTDVHKVVREFVQLYRSFAWMDFFLKVWQGEAPYSKISEIWAKEAKLNFRKLIDFEVLVEFNENMLKSAPKNAILITNGDNDTYPAWYLQERGVRKDVLIVNRSLFNLKEYVQFLQKNGLPLEISEQELDEIKHKKENGKIITKSDQLIKLLAEQNKMPVVFSVTVYNPERFGYSLELSGLVYEIGEEDVDFVRTHDLLHKTLSFDKLLSVPIDSLSIHIQNLSKNYAAVAFQLSIVLEKQAKYEEAIKEIEFAKRFSDEPMFYHKEAMLYFKLGKKDMADSTLDKLFELHTIDLGLKKEIAELYYENNMKEAAIKILAECLKDNPADKEILDLIKKYQEEL